MGRFAMGSSAFGISFGVDVNVLNDAPGPHRMSAWKPGEGRVAWGMAESPPVNSRVFWDEALWQWESCTYSGSVKSHPAELERIIWCP